MTLGKYDGIPVGSLVGTAPGARDAEEVAIIVGGSHIDVAEFVPVGKTLAGGADIDVATAELSVEEAPTAVLDATEEPVIDAVALVAEEAVAEAEIPVPVVKDACDEPTPVLVGSVVSVPFPAAVVVGALPVPVIIELEPITEDPTPVLVGSVESVPFPAAVVVGALPVPVGALEISVEVG
jgi:hypothetical protein